MFGVLRHNQLAPPGWMVGEKLLYRVLGGDEQVLRLPALIGAGIVQVLTGVLTYRMVGRWAALLAMALVATSPKLLEYSGELKQYAVEAGAAVIVLLVASMTPTGQCHPSSLTTALAGAHRVWYLKGADFSLHPHDYQQRVAAALQTSGTFIEARDFVGYSSYPATVTSQVTGMGVVRCDAGSDPHPRQLASNSAFACLDVARLPG
jgi:hypothetical protein